MLYKIEGNTRDVPAEPQMAELKAAKPALQSVAAVSVAVLVCDLPLPSAAIVHERSFEAA